MIHPLRDAAPLHRFRLSMQRRTPLEKQSGVTLVIMLVMLVVIALTSVSVMRGALSTDQVVNNARLQMTATQAAQIALRYCEIEMVKTPAGVPTQAEVVAPGTPNWKTFSNWHSGTMATTVPATYFADASTAPLPTKRPQCMAETTTLSGGSTAVIVTARGFSPDYAADANGNTTAGSVIWLQSTVQLIDSGT